MTMSTTRGIIASLLLFLGFSITQAATINKNLSAEKLADLRVKIFDRSLSLDDRIEALKLFTGHPENTKSEYRVCIWDPIGRSGLIFSAAKEQELRIEEYGINIELVPFISESVLVEELKSGVCDVGLMSGLRARSFNKFTGSLDSLGGMFNWEQVELAYRLMTHPSSAEHMVDGDYVVMGIAPGGAAHVFVNDKQINTLEKAAGKRVLVLDYDPMQAKMVAGIGATPVVSDLANAGNKFNNGNVDVLAAPVIAYGVMELHKGLEPDGGIIDLPLAYISVQLIGRSDVIPNEAAQLVREAMFYEGFDRVREMLDTEFEKIPPKWFVTIPNDERLRYDKIMQEVRLKLIEEDYYDPKTLSILRKIRCKSDPTRPECSDPVE